MKTKRQRLTNQRRAIDSRLGLWLAARDEPAPRAGWLRAVRESLGLSTRQLAARLGITQRTLQSMEEGEVEGTVTLRSLKKVARAMSCRLVYAVVPDAPNASLEDIVAPQATAFAEGLTGPIQHTMALEDQAVGEAESDAQTRELADEARRKLDPRIWNIRS